MLKLQFDPFPEMVTDRLILRRTTMADVPDLFLLRSNPEAMKYIDKHFARSEDQMVELVQRIDNGINNNTAIAWMIVLKEEGKLIGTISFHRIDTENHRAEIGYMLHPGYWRKGIVSEAVTAVMDYGFETLQFHSIEAHINPFNEASRNLLKKHGFVTEAYFKENFFFDGKFLDTEILSLLKSAR